ncbi:MAG TPA: FAD-dependent oxidoreductase, partial [Armatimonadota bacterium]|nr:FAD-dependent oxidoreductase [Armatimonadota bacterium]
MEPLIQSHADIVVAGGGPAGVAAAIAAARLGADVTLVERYGFLGGMATNGFIFPFMPWHAGDREIIRGIWGEMCDRMKQYNAGRAWSYPGDFDVEGLKQIWLDMCLQAGVKILFHTLISDTMVENNRVKGIITHSKSGREELSAKLVIDCTGDGDVAARAGAPFEIGRSQDGLMQPMTLHFRLGNVDKTKMPSREDINNLYNQGKAAGKITNPREDLLWFDTSYTDQIHFNTTRVIKVDGTNRDDLTRAEIESRRQTVELFDWITKTIPGFEHAYLLATGPQIGIRESRRIMGEHLVTDEELLNLTKFPDAIALSSYPIDIHNPSGTGTVLKMIPRGEYYSIPYRALVPLQIEGLLVA